MTCGMLCVMGRERRGVLHLDKYSPPKANWWGGKGKEKEKKKKKKREERERKGKRTSSSLINKERSCSYE